MSTYQRHNAFPKTAGSRETMKPHWSRRQGLLYYQDRLYVPDVPSMRQNLITDHHSNAQSGHLGFVKTLHRIRENYYWPSLRSDVSHFVNTCDPCQRINATTTNYKPLNQAMDIPVDRFHTIQMDFLPAPRTETGEDNILIIVDKLTKFNVMIPCKRTDSAITIARLFFEQWYCRGFPLPHTIISDRDSKFVSDFWSSLMVNLDVKLTLSTARHQKTNGLAEHIVKMTKKCIRALPDPAKLWPRHLQTVSLALNTSVVKCTGKAPLELQFGLSRSSSRLWNPAPDIAKSIQDAITASLEEQDRSEQTTNRSKTKLTAIPDDSWVLLDRTGLKWPDDLNSYNAFLPRRIGPFRVISTDEFQNSTLALPAGWRVHPTFAREKIFPYSKSKTAMPDILDQPEPEFTVSAILGLRKIGSTYQARVHWDGYPPADATWEPLSNLTNAKEILTHFLKKHTRWHFLLQKLDQLLGTPTELVHFAPAPAISELDTSEVLAVQLINRIPHSLFRWQAHESYASWIPSPQGGVSAPVTAPHRSDQNN